MINEDELEEMAGHFRIPDDEKRRAAHFYDGFQFTVDGKRTHFYNNASIIRYLNSADPRKLIPYRTLTGENLSHFASLIKSGAIVTLIYDLVETGGRWNIRRQSFTRDDYDRLQTLMNRNWNKTEEEEGQEQMDSGDHECLLRFMFNLGYLTQVPNNDDDLKMEPTTILVELPNNEVKRIFRDSSFDAELSAFFGCHFAAALFLINLFCCFTNMRIHVTKIFSVC
jgi:hypothetical protein